MDLNTSSDAITDFSEIVEEDMDFIEETYSQQSLTDMIGLLNDERDIRKKFNITQRLCKDFIPKTSILLVESKIFKDVMPVIKELFDNVFVEINELLPEIENQRKAEATIVALQGYLRMNIKILELLDGILEYILINGNIDICYVRSILLSTIEILLLTFQHCKNSNELYKNHFNGMTELIPLFKIAQEVHGKILKLIESQINNSITEESEISLLKEILTILSKIGEALIDTNIKSLADNWKSYTMICKKFSEVLNEHFFDPRTALTFILNEIISNLNKILDSKAVMKDLKIFNQILKLTNFFLKIALRLYDIFWPNMKQIGTNILNFVVSLYRFHPPYLKHKNYNEVIVKQIDEQICVHVNLFLNKFLQEPEFYQISNWDRIKHKNPECIFVLTTAFNALATGIKNNSFPIDCYNINNLMSIFFDVVKDNYTTFFWMMEPLPKNNRCLYDLNVENLASIVSSLNINDYNSIEETLLCGVLQPVIWKSLLATDLWILILKSCSPEVCYKTLNNLIQSTEPILTQTFVQRPEIVSLRNLLKSLYILLPNNFKTDLIGKYVVNQNLFIWKVLGFKDFPQIEDYHIESVIIELSEKTEKFSARNSNLKDFVFVCDAFQALSTISDGSKLNLQHLLTVYMKIWNFKMGITVFDTPYFRLLFYSLCQFFKTFVIQFKSSDINLIFTKLKQMIELGLDIKIHVIDILNHLSKICLPISSQQMNTIVLISDILSLLLADKNPIIQQCALETFERIVNKSPHEEIAQNAISKDKKVKKLVTDYLEKIINPRSTLKTDDYFNIQQKYVFKHECIDFEDEDPEESSHKRRKIDKQEVNVITNRIKSDVSLLHRTLGLEHDLDRNLKEILDVLNRQTNFSL